MPILLSRRAWSSQGILPGRAWPQPGHNPFAPMIPKGTSLRRYGSLCCGRLCQRGGLFPQDHGGPAGRLRGPLQLRQVHRRPVRLRPEPRVYKVSPSGDQEADENLSRSTMPALETNGRSHGNSCRGIALICISGHHASWPSGNLERGSESVGWIVFELLPFPASFSSIICGGDCLPANPGSITPGQEKSRHLHSLRAADMRCCRRGRLCHTCFHAASPEIPDAPGDRTRKYGNITCSVAGYWALCSTARFPAAACYLHLPTDGGCNGRRNNNSFPLWNGVVCAEIESGLPDVGSVGRTRNVLYLVPVYNLLFVGRMVMAAVGRRGSSV